jgi:hypothetical protein
MEQETRRARRRRSALYASSIAVRRPSRGGDFGLREKNSPPEQRRAEHQRRVDEAALVRPTSLSAYSNRDQRRRTGRTRIRNRLDRGEQLGAE